MPVFRDTHSPYITDGDIFQPDFTRFNRPDRIVTLLGTYFSSAQLLEGHGELNYVREQGIAGQTTYSADSVRKTKEAIRWTRWIIALNRGRKWAKVRIAERLAPMLQTGIALAIVPSHDPFNTEPPLRLLVQELASSGERIDATGCLIRHTKINRIVYGGRSDRALHLATIRLDNPELIAGKRVLLLDDIAKSGQSLMTCRMMLLQAGATIVQAATLGRVL